MPSTEPSVLVTGDAVALDLRPASFAARLVSFLIDGAIQIAVLIGLLLGALWLIARFDLDATWGPVALVAAPVLAFVALPVLLEQLRDGRSPGRAAMGTRVVRDDGGPVHLRQSLLRSVMAMLEIWSASGLIAAVTSLVDARGRRLGDLLAGTFVVQERMRVDIPPPLRVPPELEVWARGADIGRLDPQLAADARMLLARAPLLARKSRQAIGHDLVERTLPAVSPPPPPGTDPERFLRAVLAERSTRERARLRAELERADAALVAVSEPLFVRAEPSGSGAVRRSGPPPAPEDPAR